MNRTLRLRRESLHLLTTDDLSEVVGANTIGPELREVVEQLSRRLTCYCPTMFC